MPGGKLRDGDEVRLHGNRRALTVLVDADDRAARPLAGMPMEHEGTGCELFAFMRHGADGAEAGASAMLTMAGL